MFKPQLKNTYLFLLIAVVSQLLSCTDKNGKDGPLEPIISEQNIEGVEVSLINESHDDLVWPSCLSASPTLVKSRNKDYVLAITESDGIFAVDPDTLKPEWSFELPKLDGYSVSLLATPIVVNENLIIAYQLTKKGIREIHQVAAFNLEEREFSQDLPTITLEANHPTSTGLETVNFKPQNALSRAALAVGFDSDHPDGLVYVGFGNKADIQPWHGWLFELDILQWMKSKGVAAVSSSFLTTPENFCPPEGESGSRGSHCGGGIWAPSGPLVVNSTDGFDLLVPTGNGQLDLLRKDYSNSILRIKPGLQFNPACSVDACRSFDPMNPSESCIASCEHLFIPRLAIDSDPLRPENGLCDNASYQHCLSKLDYDLGANSPAVAVMANGKKLVVMPGKDGAVSLVDYKQLGKLYDRMQIVDVCGTKTDPCKIDWAGMIITQPLIEYINNEPIVYVTTFMPDKSHVAGTIALGIEKTGDEYSFSKIWQSPDPKGKQAVKAFRNRTTRPIITKIPETELKVVWQVDVRPSKNGIGTLLGYDHITGETLFTHALVAQGRAYVKPLYVQDRLFTSSCNKSKGPGRLEVVLINALKK